MPVGRRVDTINVDSEGRIREGCRGRLGQGHRCHHSVRRRPGCHEAVLCQIFGLPLNYEDPHSAVFKFGGTLVNLLTITPADELISPATVAPRDAGSRMVFTIGVDDVDAMCETLASRGVELLNGPMDRPWGIRTASFADPGGYIWEIAQ